ncbi:MAG TPA: transketolase C-terminal domain-containing protein [Candidatus Nanoarchaeia archaeon]|nr:transketolase C-terminal domain-containing protein [Candidatus Nanoarchaeia archaeon]
MGYTKNQLDVLKKENYPIDLSKYIELSFSKATLENKETLLRNIQLIRDSIVFFTAHAGAKGLSGHTGGAYDVAPEMMIIDGFRRGKAKETYPIVFDTAGHRVAIHYQMLALQKKIPVQALLHYREAGWRLPGHPEREYTPGLEFSSGRLGHMWSYVNGVSMQNPGKRIFLFGSDGSLQEGNEAEAARCAVAHKLPITFIVDDNDVTIAGHPSEYMHGYSVADTLDGHGLKIIKLNRSDDISRLYTAIFDSYNEKGPVAIVMKGKMAPGIEGIEGSNKGHDVIPTDAAIKYLEKAKQTKAAEVLKSIKVKTPSSEFLGSSKEFGSNRQTFGKACVEVLESLSDAERRKNHIFDCDLEGSTGINVIHEKFQELYTLGGVMERNNYAAAAGFGSQKGFQGIFATFAAFNEMLISEETMARLNDANVLSHFSHSGVDDMADNTCHFGINNFFADGGIPEGDKTRLYFPADTGQMKAVVKKVWKDEGLRFIFSTRSKSPAILDEKGNEIYGKGYSFKPGKDEVIREGKSGYIVSYGSDMLYRCLDAVERLREEGIDVGLINKPTLNVVDEEMMKNLLKSGFVLVVESQNYKTGLGERFGTWLAQRGQCPKYDHMGTTRQGSGGLWEQIYHQGLDPVSIMKKVRSMR